MIKVCSINESSTYEDFIRDNQNNATYKKCATICKKYGYELVPASCYVEKSTKSGRLYIRFGIRHPAERSYQPIISYERGRFLIQIASTRYNLNLDEFNDFMRANTAAQSMVKELSKIDLSTLNQIEMED